jgi:hypothetical protein
VRADEKLTAFVELESRLGPEVSLWLDWWLAFQRGLSQQRKIAESLRFICLPNFLFLVELLL